MPRVAFSRSVAAALGAALLFGASTPLAKALLRDMSPVLLAGVLYLGSGVGLGLVRIARDRGWRTPSMAKAEWFWLLLAIGFGGVLGPLALMLGGITLMHRPTPRDLQQGQHLGGLMYWEQDNDPDGELLRAVWQGLR